MGTVISLGAPPDIRRAREYAAASDKKKKKKALKKFSRMFNPPLPGPLALGDELSSLCHPTVPRSEGFQNKLVSPAPSTALL